MTYCPISEKACARTVLAPPKSGFDRNRREIDEREAVPDGGVMDRPHTAGGPVIGADVAPYGFVVESVNVRVLA